MDRADLYFPELVHKHFHFLGVQGFRCVKQDVTFVRFESSVLFVNIYHGRRSYEIGLEFGQPGNSDDEDNPYNISVLLELMESPIAKEYKSYMTHTLDGVDDGLEKLARIFYENVKYLEDAKILKKLKIHRQIILEKYWQDIALEQMRRKLDEAWCAKDFHKVVKLLSPMRDTITLVEICKLEYSETQISKTKLHKKVSSRNDKI